MWWLLIWYIVGVLGFLYWYNRDMEELKNVQPEAATLLAYLTAFMGFFGVLNWIIGWTNHRNNEDN